MHSVKLPSEKIARIKIDPKEFFAVSKLEARPCVSTGIKKITLYGKDLIVSLIGKYPPKIFREALRQGESVKHALLNPDLKHLQ